MKSPWLVALLVAAKIGLSESRAADDIEKANRAQEEKTVRLLTDIEQRVRKMLDIQTAINGRTRDMHKAIQATQDKKPRPEDLHALRQIAVKQKETIDEADRVLALLEADNSAVAFIEVFQALRKDMEGLQRRLKAGDVGPDTQAIEQDISELLKEMLSAVTKG